MERGICIQGGGKTRFHCTSSPSVPAAAPTAAVSHPMPGSAFPDCKQRELPAQPYKFPANPQFRQPNPAPGEAEKSEMRSPQAILCIWEEMRS